MSWDWRTAYARFEFFDLFAGIGGFRAGLERAGGFRCVGHCEIDPHADKAYRAIHDIKPNEAYFRNAREIEPEKLPDFDILCAGFPCQSFSIAGKRRGFEDQRGTLFFEIARIIKAKHPPFLLLENVPGLLSHDGGRTFKAILDALSELGYGVEWQVLNSKDFGVPQSRKRVYIAGYLDAGCAGKIFPFTEADGKAPVQVIGGTQGSRVYDISGTSCTVTSGTGGMGGKAGLYLVPCKGENASFIDLCMGDMKCTETARCLTAHYAKDPISHRKEASGVLLIKEATRRGYKEAAPGDTVDTSYAEQNMKRARVGKGIAYTLTTKPDKAVVEPDMRIRRLTPKECLRLQGFSDGQIDRLLAVTSDSQAYKQAGNAVTVNVVEAVGRRIRSAAKAARGARQSPTVADIVPFGDGKEKTA